MRLRFWINQGLQNLALILGATALYSFLMFIQTDDGLDSLLVLLPLYLLLFGGMLTVATTLGIYKLSVPLVLSFGSTRNEVLLGLQICRAFPIILVPALAAVLTVLSSETAAFAPADVLLLGAGAFLAFSALGTVLGVVFTKYGKIATVVTAISVMLIGFGAGIIAALSDEIHLPNFFFGNALPWAVLCAGLFFYSISMIPEQRIVWKCNVKL